MFQRFRAGSNDFHASFLRDPVAGIIDLGSFSAGRNTDNSLWTDSIVRFVIDVYTYAYDLSTAVVAAGKQLLNENSG
jgi:hypothetical protein